MSNAVTWMGHSTVLVELDGGRILTDPTLRNRMAHLRRIGPFDDAAALRGVDAVLISHLHRDHFDLPSLKRLGRSVPIIVPRGAGKLLRRRRFERVVEVLDVALVPIWGWGPSAGTGHLDPRRAAAALRLLRPRLAVPIHWGTYYPLWPGRSLPAFLTEPIKAFRWYAEELAPSVGLRVLPVGGRLELDA